MTGLRASARSPEQVVALPGQTGSIQLWRFGRIPLGRVEVRDLLAGDVGRSDVDEPHAEVEREPSAQAPVVLGEELDLVEPAFGEGT